VFYVLLEEHVERIVLLSHPSMHILYIISDSTVTLDVYKQK